MAKQIRNSDIAQKDLFGDIRQSAEATLIVLKQVEDELRDIGKRAKNDIKALDLGSAEDISKLNKQIEDLNKQVKLLQKTQKAGIRIRQGIDKQQKEEVKLRKQLKDSTDDQVKAKLKFNKANKAQRDELKQIIILEDKQSGTLEKLAANTALLRLERSKLDLETEQGQNRLKEINDQIDENNELLLENSDKLKKNRLQVGGYADGIKEALGQTSIFGDTTGQLSGIQEKLGAIIAVSTVLTKKNAEVTEDASKSQTRFGRNVRKVSGIIKASLIGALFAAAGAVTAFFTGSQEGSIELQQRIAQVTSAIGAFTGRVIDFGKGIFNFINAVSKGTVDFQRLLRGGKLFELDPTELERATKAFDSAFREGLADEIAKAADAASELVKSQFAAANAARAVAIEIERRRKVEEELREISDDDTRGFIERQTAAAELTRRLEGTSSALALQGKLTRDTLKIAQDRALLAVRERAGDQVDINSLKSQIASGKALSEVLLETSQLRGANNALIFDTTALDELIEAEKALIANEIELNGQRLAERARIRKILFDEVEQELDFLIDGTDQIKSNNEKIIDSERATFIARKQALSDTIDLLRDANKAVLDELAKTVDGISGNEIARAFDEALNVSDLNKRLKELGLAEIPINRLLELFREIQTQERDIRDAGETINQALLGGEEARERIKILQESVTLTAELAEKLIQIGKVDISKLDAKGLQNLQDRIDAFNQESEDKERQKNIDFLNLEIEQLQKRLALEVEGSQARLTIQEELLNKQQELLQAETDIRKDEIDKQLEAQKQADQKRLDQAKKTGDQLVKVADFVDQLLDQRNEKRIDELDQQLADSQKRQDEIREAINAGNEAARESLTQERRNQEELRRERDRQIAKAKRQELALAVFKAYSANISKNVQNPLLTTIKEAAQLQGFVNALPQFFEGAELVSKNLTPQLPGKDGHIVRLDGSERVMTGNENKMLGGISNTDLANLGKAYNSGHDIMPKENEGTMRVVKSLHVVADQVNKLPGRMPVSSFEYDQVAKMTKEIVRQENKKTINQSRLKKWA